MTIGVFLFFPHDAINDGSHGHSICDPRFFVLNAPFYMQNKLSEKMKTWHLVAD